MLWTSKNLPSYVAAVAFTVALTPLANAALITYDLRVAPTQSGTVQRLSEKSARVSSVGDVVRIELYAVLADADGLDADTANDGVAQGQGSFFSGTNGLKGNLSAALNAGTNAFAGAGSSAGSAEDLDLDGDLDVGTTGTDIDSTGSFVAFSSRSVGGVPVFTGGANALLGHVDFVVTDTGGGSTSVRFVPRRVDTGGTNASRQVHNFTIDGTRYGLGSGTNGTFTDVGAGPAVQISTGTPIPEPTAVGLLAGAAAVVALRRRR